MGKEEKEDSPPQSIKGFILSFLLSSLCSIALPVGLSFYFAPEKSLAYFQDTVQDKVDMVRSIELSEIYALGANIASEVPPMLSMEYDVLKIIGQNAPPALRSTADSVVYLDYRITLSLVLAIAIGGYFFPFKECKDWIVNVVWGSVCLVAGFLPVDSGMDVLADKDAGMYKMTVMICAVILTLAANYLAVIVMWWLLGKVLSTSYRLIVRRKKGSSVKKDVKKVDKKKEVKKEEEDEIVEDDTRNT